MKITLRGEDAIRLEPTPGALSIEAATADMGYSPFHMLASALASCTFSVLQSWATHKKLSVDDLVLDVQWKFADDPHRVSDIGVEFTWPSLPADRIATARRVAALCTVHATLTHSPHIAITSSAEPVTVASGTPTAASGASTLESNMHGDPAAAPTEPVTTASGT